MKISKGIMVNWFSLNPCLLPLSKLSNFFTFLNLSGRIELSQSEIQFRIASHHAICTSAMASFAATSSQCNLVRHGQSSSLRQQPIRQPALLAFPSSVSSQPFSFSSTSVARFGLSVATESRSVQTAAVRKLTGSLMKAKGLRFAVVVARFNELVTKLLLEGALETFEKYSVNEEDVDVIWVPGAFEIGVAAQHLGKSGKYNAVLCIGAVVKGDTSHYDAVVNSATSGVLSAGLNSGVPCIFGVLTCDDMDQALNRAGGKAGNKGAETALTAIEMASLFEHDLKQ